MKEYNNLRKKLDYLGINNLTEIELIEKEKQSSFFNNLTVPDIQTFLERKTSNKEFSFTQWQEISANLSNRHSKIINFISNKVEAHLTKKVTEATTIVKQMLSKNDKIVLDLFIDIFGVPYDHNIYILNLDGYLNFIADKSSFSTEDILLRISNVYQNIEDGRKEYINKISLIRLLSSLITKANENLIQTIYSLQYSPKLLKLVLKRNKDLQSFRNDPKRLIKLVTYNDRHYNKFLYSRYYNTRLKLKKEQVIEFSKFYLKTDDKRLNSENIINELCLHLKKYDEVDLINKLVLNHHRLYSSVIAGHITKNSYSIYTKQFLQYMLGEKYNDFWDLVTIDDNKNFSNSIKISFSRND